MSLIDLESLDALFNPQSVAIIGASGTPTKIGGRPIEMLRLHQYAGRILPVNPGASEVQGLRSYPDVASIEGDVDVAILAVPRPAVEGALKQCAAKGVRGVVMFSAGYAEVDEAGAQEQRRLMADARAAGMRVMGPNCMGYANLRTGMIATFHPAFLTVMPPTGRIGMVTQSGAFGGLSANMASERGVAFSHIMTTGNEGDVQAPDCLAWLARDPDTEVIMLYLEGCRDGPRLLEALRLAHENRKPVVAIKLGRTDAGARAASSHTAALAGSDAIFDAMFRQYGVYRANSIEEFFDIGVACSIRKPPAGNKIGLVTVSGGVGVLMADDAESRGLDVAPLPQAARQQMKALVPFAGVENPLDVTGQILSDVELLNKGMHIILEGGNYDSVVCFLGASMRNPEFAKSLIPAWQKIAADTPGKALAIAGMVDPDTRLLLDSLGIPTFAEPTHATRAIAALDGFRKALDRRFSLPAIGGALPPLPAGPITELSAMACLRAAGLPTVEQRLATSADDAVAAATAIGLPVVLKVVSPDILHKSDVGGVRVNLGDADAVRSAYDTIIANARRAKPGARIDGCLVAPMVRGGVETILGVSHDPVFGPAVMFGLGGIFVEALGDVAFRLAPFGIDEAHRMIDSIRGRKVLDGLRGAPPADLDALAEALSALSRFAAHHADALLSAEANPFVVFDKGALALDAVIELAPDATPA
ncbi:MAG: acetate--CoA ligase family protein [Burkholderiaceae bacterium]